MILITGSPRTGTSLIAKIFVNHGVWVGEFLDNARLWGYKHYENNAIKQSVKQIGKRYYTEGGNTIGEPIKTGRLDRERIRVVVEGLEPKEPWLFKVGSEYAPLFLQFEPKIVMVKRDEDQAIKAIIERGSSRSKTEARKILRRRIAYMKTLEKDYGAKWVYPDELLAGDYTSIKQALEYSGIEYDEDKVTQSIDKTLWHTR